LRQRLTKLATPECISGEVRESARELVIYGGKTPVRTEKRLLNLMLSAVSAEIKAQARNITTPGSIPLIESETISHH
jgi:hypothetical protein